MLDVSEAAHKGKRVVGVWKKIWFLLVSMFVDDAGTEGAESLVPHGRLY